MDNIKELIESRHSVRQYLDKPIEEEKIHILEEEIASINKESGLHIQLVKNEPKAFSSFMAHYGKFDGVKNYFALIGNKDDDIEEKCGYYGECLVLKAQEIGLNTCWVAMTYKKIPSAYKMGKNEKLCIVIALGYGVNSGHSHKIKTLEQVSNYNIDMSNWFKEGVLAALKAPTAMNQQKFYFTYENGNVILKTKRGFYTKIDLGIVKYHFEIVSKKKVS